MNILDWITIRHQSTFCFNLDHQSQVVSIIDLNCGKSVTNDAENVIRTVLQYGEGQGLDLNGYSFIYQDSNGRWDELLVKDREFMDFRLLGADCRERAMRALG